MSTYRITEPHPSLPRSRYLSGGRGGAGNFTHVQDPKTLTDPQTASGPASRTQLTPPPSNAFFYAGRGGSGNAYRERERAMFSFDEELAQQRRQMERAAPVYHVGRGGAGNAVDEMKPGSSIVRRGGSTSSTESAGSAGAAGSDQRGSLESAWQRVSRTFSRA